MGPIFYYKRVKQVINGERIYTVYGLSGAILCRDNVTTGIATDYIRMGGQSIARIKSSGETSYLHADHLGSPVAATDASGNLLWRETFTPYGESLNPPAANTDQDGFTGHIRDTDTGLTYMQARYYNPVIGRFLSNDPVGFAEGGVDYFNRYAYTANDPVNNIDPDGRQFGRIIKGLKALKNLVTGKKKPGDIVVDEVVGIIDDFSTIANNPLSVDAFIAA